jgi:protein O-GlcNAc transferase
VRIDPLFADAYSNMGNTYKDLGRLDDAVKCYMTAIQLQPSYADAYANLGSAYKDAADLPAAITCYKKALELNPVLHDAYANLVHAMMLVCDWEDRGAHMAKLSAITEMQLSMAPSGSAAGALALAAGAAPTLAPMVLPSVQPFHALAYPMGPNQRAIMQAIAQRYAARAVANVALLDMAPFKFRTKAPSRRLHIGYVSSDFGNHPLAHLMQSVFRLHDRERVQVTCYATSPHDMSTWRRVIEEGAERFQDISSLTNDDAARLIHADGVHILVNLNGYTKGARNEIFALRPAPLQCSYMGFCGTIGASYVQYMIADPTVVPRDIDHQAFYDEKMVYMPHSYFVCDHRQSSRYVLDFDDPEKKPRSYYGVPEDKFVFCNFNQLYKIDPEIFDVWCSILKRVSFLPRKKDRYDPKVIRRFEKKKTLPVS